MQRRTAASVGQVAVPQYDLPAGVPALPKLVPGPVPPVKQVQPAAERLSWAQIVPLLVCACATSPSSKPLCDKVAESKPRA